MEEIINKKIRNEGAKTGIALGIILVFLSILPLYYFATSSSFWMVIIGPVITGFLLPIVIAGMLTVKLRKKIGGYWEFKQAATGIFMMMFVAFIISSIASYVYEEYIHPDMKEKYVWNVANNTIVYMENAGVDTEQIDAQLEKLDEQLEESTELNIMSVISGLVISIIIVFGISLIYAAIFKREKPVFYDHEEIAT